VIWIDQEHETMSTITNPPAQAAPYRKEDTYPPALAIFSIGILTVLLALFNTFPQYIGVGWVADGAWTFTPVLSPNFFVEYLPLLNILWGLSMALSFVHLGLRRWTLGTRIADLGLAIFGIYILFQMITGGPIFAFQDTWITGLDWAVTPVLWLLLVLSIIGAVKKLVDVFNQQ
jgi:hypothetical protein